MRALPSHASEKVTRPANVSMYKQSICPSSFYQCSSVTSFQNCVTLKSCSPSISSVRLVNKITHVMRQRYLNPNHSSPTEPSSGKEMKYVAILDETQRPGRVLYVGNQQSDKIQMEPGQDLSDQDYALDR